MSFLTDVAPLLVKNCIGCHNVKKSESKYDLTTFQRLAKGGQQGAGITLEAGKPDESRLVELIRHDAVLRMPFKQDPLPPESVSLIERWVREGARYDGDNPGENWVELLRRRAPVVVPERYPIAVPIASLTFSPDGRSVVTSGNSEVNVWKFPDEKPAHRLRGVAERVHAIAYSPDGRWLATASGVPGRFGAVELWAAEPDGSGRPVREVFTGDDSVFTVAFSPDSKHLAAAGSDRAVRVWEVASGSLEATIEDHADWIFGLAFSPDGRLVGTASRDKTSKVFDWAKKETLATFAGHADTVYAVAFTPDGRQVATGGGDGLVRIWSPFEDAKQSAMLGGFKGPVFRVVIGPDGKTLVACSADRTVRVYEGNVLKRTLNGHADWIQALALSPDGETIASGSWDGEVRLWHLSNGDSVASFFAAPGLSRVARSNRQP